MKNKTRQWNLYLFLKGQHDYLTRQQIMDLSGLYPDNNARLLTSDLQAIKKQPEIKRIIITSRKGIKIAETKEEAKEYFEKEQIELLKRLKLYHLQSSQYGLDKQTRIVFHSEKDTVEVFSK